MVILSAFVFSLIPCSHLFMYQVMPAVVSVMKEMSTLVTLVKPQFECRRSQVRGFEFLSFLGVLVVPIWLLFCLSL